MDTCAKKKLALIPAAENSSFLDTIFTHDPHNSIAAFILQAHHYQTSEFEVKSGPKMCT